MTPLVRAAAAAVGLAACTSCPALEAGTYEVTATEVEGNCGGWRPTPVAVVAGELPFLGQDDGCEGPVDLAADGCTVTFDRTCPLSPDGTLRYEGFAEPVSSDAAGMQFTMSATFGGISCRSFYDGTAERR